MKKIHFPFLFLVLCVLFSSCINYQDVSVSGVQDFRIISLDQKGIEAEIGIKINNPNTFGFNVYKSSCDTKINNEAIGEAKLTKKIHVKAKSNDVHYFRISADFSKLSAMGIANILTLALKKNISLSLKGNIKVGNLFHKERIPVDINERVPIKQ